MSEISLGSSNNSFSEVDDLSTSRTVSGDSLYSVRGGGRKRNLHRPLPLDAGDAPNHRDVIGMPASATLSSVLPTYSSAEGGRQDDMDLLDHQVSEIDVEGKFGDTHGESLFGNKFHAVASEINKSMTSHMLSSPIAVGEPQTLAAHSATFINTLPPVEGPNYGTCDGNLWSHHIATRLGSSSLAIVGSMHGTFDQASQHDETFTDDTKNPRTISVGNEHGTNAARHPRSDDYFFERPIIRRLSNDFISGENLFRGDNFILSNWSMADFEPNPLPPLYSLAPGQNSLGNTIRNASIEAKREERKVERLFKTRGEEE